MNFCSNCGTQLADETKFCPSCGKATGVAQTSTAAADKTQEYQKKVEEAVKDFVNTKDETAEFDAVDIENNKILALLSYLGLFFLIPLLAAPQSKYAKFHVNQGLNLFIVGIIIGIANAVSSVITTVMPDFLGAILGFLFGVVFFVLSIATLALTVIGIVNAVQGKAKELPIIGHFRLIK